MLDKKDLVAIRNAIAGDRNFILATWLRGLRYGNDWVNLIESGAYYKNYHDVVEGLLNNPGVTTDIACLKDDPEVILGYSVYQGSRLDWLFVKKAWRGIGIAKSLIPKGITTVSHLTEAGKGILRKHPEVKFDPFFSTP